MLKCSKNSEGTAELEEALATVLDIIKSVNDSMHQIAITGYEVLFAVAFTLVLTHPVFLSSLIMLCPWLGTLCRSLCHFLEGCHSVACCGDWKYMSTNLSCEVRDVNVGKKCDECSPSESSHPKLICRWKVARHNLRDLLKLCDHSATQVFPNLLHWGRKIWLSFKVGNRNHPSDWQTHYLKHEIITDVQIKGHKCIYLSTEAPLKSYDFQELVLPT